MLLQGQRPRCVGLTGPTVRRHNRVAPFMKRNPDANAEPMDIEDLTALGNSASGPCPYFLSREMAATADIIFMPAGFPLLLSMHGEVVTWGLQSC
jgi:DEAD_2